ncbi:MAG: DNA-formamidopyrimidine glycosylase family protein [Aeromicrobium sp.]
MPEGDTVWRTAQHLDEVLAGTVLTRTDFRVPAFATCDLSGLTVDEVVSRGKHLLIRAGSFSIHTHLKMEGAWHIYPHGARWERPAFQARVVLENATHQAIGFSLGITEVLARDDEDRAVGHLGPDLLGPDWDAAEALRRLHEHPDQPVFLALHDQRNLAGLGNEYVNELCFLSGVLPTRPVGDLPDLSSVVERGHRMILANRDRVQRTMTGDTRPGRMHWVIGRSGRPCRRCGTMIRSGELGAKLTQMRITYWCPQCQS